MVVPKWILILDEPWSEASLQEGNCDSQKSLCWSVGTGLSMQYERERERERGPYRLIGLITFISL